MFCRSEIWKWKVRTGRSSRSYEEDVNLLNIGKITELDLGEMRLNKCIITDV